jgi:uncharacterized protein YjbI with pentapeptide repeats
MSDDQKPGPQAGQRVDWKAANLQGVNLAGMNLEGADLRAADLRGVNFSGSNLRYADFRGAMLHYASFHNASLYGAKMQGAEAFGADFRGADLRQANMGGAYLEGAVWTAVSPADLRERTEPVRTALPSGLVASGEAAAAALKELTEEPAAHVGREGLGQLPTQDPPRRRIGPKV